MARYSTINDFLSIRENAVREAVGRIIRFKYDGALYEGKIDNVILTPDNIPFAPESSNPFVGIKVKMRDGGEVKLLFDDRRINFIEF